MKLLFQATVGLLALCLATCTVKWCTISDAEQAKCADLQACLQPDTPLTCVRKSGYRDCIEAISKSEADAVTLDGGLVYEAGLAPYNLNPVAAEVYGPECATSYYAVAVVKKGSDINSLCDLRGKKSCHTGMGRSAGWNIPIGRLLDKNCTTWAGAEIEPIEKMLASFVSASCVPEVQREQATLCRLCQRPECLSSDPYAGYAGALKCLTDEVGDVAYVKHTTALSLPEEERKKYELLCDDDRRQPLDQYASCNLASVPAHAVVARSVDGHTDEIWSLISTLQTRFPKGTTGQCQYFGSSHGKDLIIKDSAEKLIRVPAKMDSHLFVTPKYYAAMQNIRRVTPAADTGNKVRWCTVGRDEKTKCDTWSVVSGGAIECAVADSPEDAIVKIAKGEADAVSLDGGLVFVAGKCGLVPIAREITTDADIEACRTEGAQVHGAYYAVAVVKKSDRDITWKNLRGKKSCHTARGRTAGWNIPVGLLSHEFGFSDVDHFFSEGCAPGSPADSPLCNLCVGSGTTPAVQKCAANSQELYYGYTGAFRCLVEKGQVAFVKHTTPMENTDGNNQAEWARNLKSEDFELLCRNGERRPLSSFRTCNLGSAPPHGVVTRPDLADYVRRVLDNQEALYGSSGSDQNMFKMFESGDPAKKDLIFKEGTICLGKVKKGTTYSTFLGSDYVAAIESINKISPSALVEACTFHQHGCQPSQWTRRSRGAVESGVAAGSARLAMEGTAAARDASPRPLDAPLPVSDLVPLSVLLALVVVAVTLLILKFIQTRKSSRRAVLLVGLCDSGKTLMFVRLLTANFRNTQTSITDSSALYRVKNDKNSSVTLIDLPGHESLRLQFLDRFKAAARAIVFVVDSVAFQREMKDVAEFLYQVLTDSTVLKNAPPLLVACNKQDVTMAKSSKLIQQQLEKELNTLRVTRSAAPSTLDSTNSGSASQLGKKGKEFDFSQLPMKVDFIECSARGSKGEEGSADIEGLERWIAKMA
ncbi:serotransferrin [Paroedura picta]|uniref:serotransferrin n=1 Tax=Paroedura picta TaxID=143630 RepID=UPI0040579F8C